MSCTSLIKVFRCALFFKRAPCFYVWLPLTLIRKEINSLIFTSMICCTIWYRAKKHSNTYVGAKYVTSIPKVQINQSSDDMRNFFLNHHNRTMCSSMDYLTASYLFFWRKWRTIEILQITFFLIFALIFLLISNPFNTDLYGLQIKLDASFSIETTD